MQINAAILFYFAAVKIIKIVHIILKHIHIFI